MTAHNNNDDGIVIKIRDRRYAFKPPFTNRELHIIKQVAGVRAGEIQQAFEAGDTDVLVAIAHIAVLRAGHARPTLDELWDMEVGAIQPADEEDPTPAAAPAGTQPTGDGGNQATTPSSPGAPSSASSSV